MNETYWIIVIAVLEKIWKLTFLSVIFLNALYFLDSLFIKNS